MARQFYLLKFGSADGRRKILRIESVFLVEQSTDPGVLPFFVLDRGNAKRIKCIESSLLHRSQRTMTVVRLQLLKSFFYRFNHVHVPELSLLCNFVFDE